MAEASKGKQITPPVFAQITHDVGLITAQIRSSPSRLSQLNSQHIQSSLSLLKEESLEPMQFLFYPVRQMPGVNRLISHGAACFQNVFLSFHLDEFHVILSQFLFQALFSEGQ